VYQGTAHRVQPARVVGAAMVFVVAAIATLLTLGRATLAAQPGSATQPAGPAVLEAAVRAGAQLPRLHSLLVSQRGALLLERYFNGRKASSLANIKSASKSVISALIGIAIGRGAVPTVREPVATYFPDLVPAGSPKRAITVEDLVSMRSGLETTSNRHYGAWVQSGNWVRHALSRPLIFAPGTAMEYSTGNTHLLSAILTKATRSSTLRFAQEALAAPLGFTLAPWPQDPQGVYFGGNDMLLTPRQMLAFGEMYLNRGRVGDRQVVPERWVVDSFVPRGRSRISERQYGYGWWMRPMAGHETYYAWGFGGQYIVIVPDVELVVVSTSAATVAEERRSHRRTVDEIIEQLIVAPLAD
jgi:CubicO group peptidase (beta-lactamase class C family)